MDVDTITSWFYRAYTRRHKSSNVWPGRNRFWTSKNMVEQMDKQLTKEMISWLDEADHGSYSLTVESFMREFHLLPQTALYLLNEYNARTLGVI